MWPHALGHYKVTGEEHEGAAVYKNGHGTYLYKLSNGTWRAGFKIGWAGTTGYIRSVETADCPTIIGQWVYWDSGWSSKDNIKSIQWCQPGGSSVNGFCSAGGYFCMKTCDYCIMKLN